MRASLPFALALVLVASPAAADHMARTHGVMRVHHHAFAFRHSPFVPFPTFAPAFSTFPAPFSTFSRFRHGGPFSPLATGFPLGFGDGIAFDGFGGGFGGAPGIVVLNAPPLAATPPARPMIDDRPSVERTAQGVTIIRGPGSHHTMH